MGHRNQALHPYEVRPTNLLVFGFSRVNVETSHIVCGWDLVVKTSWAIVKSFYMGW